MDGSRGFFSAAGSTPSAGAPPGAINAGSTRARPVSAGTRLRQKPANAAAHQDFFASLGIDNASRSRAGSNASTSSNRSYSSMTMRPVSASGQGSTTSLSSGWRPPPIGGLGSQRVTPPPPMPSVGSLSITGVNRSVTTTSTSSSTMSISGGGLGVTGVASAAVSANTAPVTASFNAKSSRTTNSTTTGSKPTQLFSMEDAEDLYSDDGWKCDSPSAVLSNPADETETKEMTTATVLAAAAAAAAEAPVDEFAWGDDDDAFASPVPKTKTSPTQPPAFEIPATEASTASTFETKGETAMALPPPATSFLTEPATGVFESTSFHAAQMPSLEKKSQFEHAQVQSSFAPPAAVPQTSLSTEETHPTFETKSYTNMQVPPQDARSPFEHVHAQAPPPLLDVTSPSTLFPTESAQSVFQPNSLTATEDLTHTAPPATASTAGESYQQDEQWEEDWGQHEESVAKGSHALETREVTTISTLATTTTTTTNIQTDTLVKAPVELASPGGAAGEFWGDGDEDELFDHDDHADEDWDETVKGQTAAVQHVHGESAASAFSGQDTSFSLPSQPPPPLSTPVAESPPKQETLPLEAQKTVFASEYPASEATQIATQEEIVSDVAASPVTPSKLQEEPPRLHSAERSFEAKPATSLDTETSPFSNAIATTGSQDSDPNVFPEAPRSARFLHTPTGTGGSFGRLPSPQGDGNSGFQDEFSGAAAHGDDQTQHNSMAFTDGERAEGQDSYENSGVRWDAGSLRSGGHDQQHEGESHRDTRQGQSDEEERDSVVSFSGENSFFPSAGRPSSLYGGSQSSFASHRMYQSSVASTDHDGSSSIASFGVSSAGATFGGSEHVSEGGAFSDGTVSETPSMVDSSNASTAFGTDYPSVSEGQFSAPGTTIGGSDNGSDGGFSDGNASEATSMCESVNTNPRLVSEFNSTRGHYVTESIERREVQEPFASSAPDSDPVAAFGESEPATASSMFGNDSSADANPFSSSPSTFPPSQHATRAPPAASTDSSFDHQDGDAIKDESVESAASLFGATAGADVPNPFSSFGASPAAPPAETKPTEEHELQSSDAGDLFGSGPSTSAFGQPVPHSSFQNDQIHLLREVVVLNMASEMPLHLLVASSVLASIVAPRTLVEVLRLLQMLSLRETSVFGGQNRYSNQKSAPGTPDSYSQQPATSAFAGSPAQPPHHQLGQGSTFGTPNKYNHHAAPEVFGSASPAQRAYGGQQDLNHSDFGRSAARGLGDHTRSSSGTSADAFFGRSSVPTGSVYQQPPAQPSFSRSGSNASSYADQHGAHVSTSAAGMRPSTQSHDLNTSYGSIDNVSLSRPASSSSMSRFESDTSFQLQQNVQHHEEPPRSPVDANSFFGGASTTEATASSFFGSAAQDSSEVQAQQHQGTIGSSMPGFQAAAPVPQQVQEQQQTYPETHREFDIGASTVASSVPAPEATPTTDVTATSGMPAMPSDIGQRDSSNVGAFQSTATNINAGHLSTNTTDLEASQFANDQNGSQPQAFDGFSGSNAQDFGGQRPSSDFFSSSPAPQAEAGPSSYQFEQTVYHHQQEQQGQAHGSAAVGMQVAETHSSFQHAGAGTDALYAARPGNYFDSGAPGAGRSSPANFSQHQTQQSNQQYQQYQQQQPQHRDTTGYGYRGGAGQSQAAGYNAADYGTAVGHKYGASNAHQTSHSVAAPVVKTSNKFKDPCVAAPSCLASFGFGGNVVTMFPKRKLRLNIAGSSFRNSPRGPATPSAFDNGGKGELRKGPVNLYRMDQLHPKNKEFEQMDMFPGPLTENVSDEAILEYLNDRLKRSEAPTSIAEAEDENDRLLLGILRVMVKCNGKLRSDPGTLNPSDPDSPEAQLIALLSESSKRRSGNQLPTFPLRKLQPATHPDLMQKHANELRELLLVGDRKGAVSTAMSAHMWPEAMLIASFTDKEEYKRVLRTYLDETYATGDPSRALFMSFADQQEKSVQEPKRLLQTNIQQSSDSLVLSTWVSHVQVLLANRTADTNKILTELGDRLWTEVNAVAAAHVCYLLAGIQVEAPMPTSKMALLGGDHRTPTEARFYVSPGAVQRTEVYEWAQKQAKGASANLMIPFQGYKLIYAMLLADHGKMETAFKYVTSMLTVIKAVTATMKPGTSMYLEGMQNQLTVLDDRLRQHLGQDRVASVAASTSSGSRKQGKWGLGSALSIMGKIVNRVVEGNDSSTAASTGPSASPGGLYANEANPPAANYPSTPSVPASTSSPAPSYPQQTPPPHAHMTPPPSSHGPVPTTSYNHATPPVSQGSGPGSSNGFNRPSVASPAGPYARQASSSSIPPSGPFSGNGRPGLQHQSPGPFSGNGRLGPQKHGSVPLMRKQHSMEPPGSNHSTHSSSSFHEMPSAMNNTPQYPPQQMHQQPPSSQTSQHSQYSQHSQGTPTARPAFQKPAPLELPGDISSLSQPKTLASGLVSEMAASLPPTDAAAMSGPSSDKGKASPKLKAKKSGRSKTPPPSGSSKGSGWLSGLSSFIATKMNPEAKVAKLGEQMEAYFDEDAKRWIFPGEAAAEEPTMPSAPPTGPTPASAPGSSVGVPPVGSNSAPGSISSGPAPSNDPLAALMAPPPSHMLMKKDPLAAMMAPPSRPGVYGARRGGSTAQHKPPRPQFAVFKPSAHTPNEPSE
ncbi:COPII coat assembly protein SEC16, putative [Phytophthora infestans T30-4]|uniref:Protein transport protein sec16 n=2 Tax=Phytophthora infestans TaxID=4787 RepID=D0MUH2_PHYIT|nr:COPII coat assembly protein SEC16, putative [Phytophthora infestans T30-4]EEY61619.1 COPII coat assembly protein SEC16, putative [Phytophthora infestans T30-4]|eukprot:XP_002908536.1 COPII coat assembly protein SEC16, putative [Phytophthora infestans T30-4]